jgi:hypothetical protein
MSDENMSLKMKIDTSYNGTGTKAAAKGIENLGTKQKTATKSSKALTSQTQALGSKTSQAAGMVGQLAQGLGASGGAAGKFGGTIGFAGAAVSGLTGGIGGLLAVIGAGAIAAWIKWNNKVALAKETLRKFREEIDKNKLAMQQAKLTTLSTFYNDLTTAIDQASAAQSRLNQAMAAADSVEKAERMAQLELEEKKALNKIAPDKSLARSETAASFATKRRELDQEFNERSYKRVSEATARALDDATKKQSVAETAVNKTKREMREIDDQRTDAYAALGALYTTNKPMKTINMPGGYNPSGMPLPGQSGQTQIVDKEAQKAEADRLEKKLYGEKGLDATYKKLAEVLAENSKQLEANKSEIKAAAMNAASATRQNKTITKINPEISKQETAAANQQNRYNRQQQLEQANSKTAELTEQKTGLQARVRKEWSEAQKVSSSPGVTQDNIDKEMEDWRNARTALKKFMAKSAAEMKSMKETADRAIEALNNLPSS